VVTVKRDDPLYLALHRMISGDFAILPVVARDNSNRLVGILSRRDIMRTMNRVIAKNHLPELADGVCNGRNG